MKIECYVCEKILDGKGGLLLSPPNNLEPKIKGADCIFKFHLCTECYYLVASHVTDLKRK